MVRISGFSYVFNALAGGYPIVEATEAVLPFVDDFLWVDADSDDGTRALLEQLASRHPGKIKIVGARWGSEAGETLARLHAMNELCSGDVILHCEADEVYDDFLPGDIRALVEKGFHDIAVHRIQIEQNFQRVRWSPWLVHRVFPKGSARKVGETTDRHKEAFVLGPEYGYLWDVTNCFRDQWRGRIEQQAELRGETPNFLAVPAHVLQPTTRADLDAFLAEPHWEWKASPFALPDRLKRLVGKTRYTGE